MIILSLPGLLGGLNELMCSSPRTWKRYKGLDRCKVLSPLCFGKHRAISGNNLVPQREAGALERVGQGRGEGSVGHALPLGLCFLLFLWRFFEAQSSCYR